MDQNASENEVPEGLDTLLKALAPYTSPDIRDTDGQLFEMSLMACFCLAGVWAWDVPDSDIAREGDVPEDFLAEVAWFGPDVLAKISYVNDQPVLNLPDLREALAYFSQNLALRLMWVWTHASYVLDCGQKVDYSLLIQQLGIFDYKRSKLTPMTLKKDYLSMLANKAMQATTKATAQEYLTPKESFGLGIYVSDLAGGLLMGVEHFQQLENPALV